VIFFGRKLLFLGAHPDDIELGCGALIAHVGKICHVMCVTLSDNQENPELKGLVEQHRRSMAVLGVPAEHVVVRDFPTRHFPRDRQKILEVLYELNRQERPDLVFAHSRADMHQDHNVVTEEALRAFRGTTVLGFDVIRSSHGFFPHFLVEVSEADVARKIEALISQLSTVPVDQPTQTIEGAFEFLRDGCTIRILPPHSRISDYIEHRTIKPVELPATGSRASSTL